MYVDDRIGDLGKILYTDYQGVHLLGDPISWWSGRSPISDAGYLDMVKAWIIIDHKHVTLGMQMASPITDGSTLPEGIKAVQWSWIFSPAPAEFIFEREVFIWWDGMEFSAYLSDSTVYPFAVTPLDSFEVSGNTLTVQMSDSALQNQIGWMYETSAYWQPTSTPTTGERGMGWGSPDCPDYFGNYEWWPCLPLP
jgi:hypothetical protein